MKNKTLLKILVVEDNEKNLQNAKNAFSEFENEGLIKVFYAKNYDEASKVKENVDCGLLDLYFPAENAEEKTKELMAKYELDSDKRESIGRVSIEELILDPQELLDKHIEENNSPEVSYGEYIRSEAKFLKSIELYPLGFCLVDELNELGKQSILVTTAASGHGAKINPFYKLRRVSENTNDSIRRAFTPSETRFGMYGLLSEIMDIENGKHISDSIEKTEFTWKVALKTIARYLNHKEIDEKIKLDEDQERKLNYWMEKGNQ